MGKYTIYGGELSYFTRKLEAAMLFYGADFEIKPKRDPSIEMRSGTHQVPVLHTPENWMIADMMRSSGISTRANSTDEVPLLSPAKREIQS